MVRFIRKRRLLSLDHQVPKQTYHKVSGQSLLKLDWSMFFVVAFRVQRGFSVQVNFHEFESRENVDIVRLYEGVGADKTMAGQESPQQGLVIS